MIWNNVKLTLERIAPVLISLYRQQIDQTNTNATGRLANTINFKLEIDNQAISLDLLLEDYWKYIEYGRKPGKQPPIRNIQNWIKVKRILPTINPYLIARKIGRYGTEGKYLLSNSLEYINKYYYELIEEAVTLDITNNLDQFLKEI